MLDRNVIFAAAAAALGAFALTEAVLTWRERKKEREAEFAEAEARFDERWDDDVSEDVLDPEPDRFFEPADLDGDVIVPDEKPDLMSYLEPVRENVFDKPEPEEEEEPEVEETVEEYLERIGKTKWDTVRVRFDEDGMPVFTQAEWDSEKAGISIISQELYNDDIWPLHDRDEAIWYPRDGVLADQEFNLLDVVDCVGPTAFNLMIKSGGRIVYVKNDNLDKCYELWENDVDFEEALEESGFDDNVKIRLE